MRAQLAENRGDQTHMRADLERAADMFRALGDDYALAMTLSSLAGTMSLTEELDEAETVLDEAMELLQELNGLSGAGLLRMRLSEIRVRRGDIPGALRAGRGVARGPRPRRATRRSSYAPRSLGWPGWPAISTTLRARAAEAVARMERVGPAAAPAGARAGDGRVAAGAGRDGGRRPRAGDRVRGPRARHRGRDRGHADRRDGRRRRGDGRSTGRARSRPPRRRSAPPRWCGAPRIWPARRSRGWRRLFVIPPMSAPARSRRTTRSRSCHARRL